MSLRRVILFVLLAVVGFLVGTGISPVAKGQADSSSFEAADCMFEVPANRTVECGYLTVPVARDADGVAIPDAGTMRLAVAIFASESDSPQPDPIIYLEGGPGGDALEAIPLTFETRFAPLLADRDFIMFDQRGTGYSEPSLACPEYNAWALTVLADDRPTEEIVTESLSVIEQCRMRLVSEGVDFANFNSRESAQDLDDLRQALGYEAWNLYGISYGTRLALTAMRDTPEGIRSAILDSSYPLQSNLYAETINNANRAFETLFEGCAADAACNAAYPNLRDVFYQVVEDLNAEPVLQQITNPITGETFDALYNGDGLVGLLFQSLYSTEIIPVLPRLITDVSIGEYTLTNALNGSFLINAEFFSLAQQLAVQCHEEVALETSFEAIGENLPDAVRRFFDLSFTLGADIVDLCATWNAGTADAIEDVAVTSAIPTLILAGEYDPITPPSYGVEVGETLENSFYYLFPGVGHGASIAGECSRGVTLAFLNDPTTAPDDSCIADLTVEFAVNQTEYTLVPFTNDTFNLSGVIPEGWTELAPGVYAESQLSTTVIIAQAAPIPPADLLEALSTQLGTPIGDTVGTYESTNYTYTIYEFSVQGLSLVLAVTEVDGTTVYALAQSLPNDSESVTDLLLMPILDSLVLN